MSEADHRFDVPPPSFRQNFRDVLRLFGVTVRLTWSIAPWLLAGIVALTAIGAAIPVAQLILSKAVIDRVSLDLGLAAGSSTLAERAPVGVWIGLAVAGIVLGQLDG